MYWVIRRKTTKNPKPQEVKAICHMTISKCTILCRYSAIECEEGFCHHVIYVTREAKKTLQCATPQVVLWGTFTHKQAHSNKYMCAHASTDRCKHTHTCPNTGMYTHAHLCTCIYTQSHTYISSHTHATCNILTSWNPSLLHFLVFLVF